MPGFINSHTHGCMPFGRTIGYDRAFDSWLPGTQLPMMRAMDLGDYADAERLTMVENLLEGNTTVLENCFSAPRHGHKDPRRKPSSRLPARRACAWLSAAAT